MNLVKTVDVNPTQALWVEMTDVDSEIVFGGVKNGKEKSKSVVKIEIEDSNVLIAFGSISFGDNAF